MAQHINDQHPSKEDEKQTANIHSSSAITNIVVLTLICVTISGTIYMLSLITDFWEEQKLTVPENYKIPEFNDFWLTIYSFVAISFIRLVFCKVISPLADTIVNSKYSGEERTANIEKISSHMFKLLYFLSMSIIGYYILRSESYFPKQFLGQGEYSSIFKDDKIEQLYFTKPEYFDVYYLATLGFVFSDTIWLVFINERQSDFWLMILHHICTISLVSFSFLTNESAAGVIIFYLHDFTDIFVSITRVTIVSKASDLLKLIVCGILLAVLVYYRLIVLGEIVYYTFAGLKPHVFNKIMLSFLSILYLMHIYWVESIIHRFVFLKIEDVGVRKSRAE